MVNLSRIKTNDQAGDGKTLFNVYAIDPMTARAVGIDGHVTRTVDGGKTWQEVKGNFPGTQLFGITSVRQGIIIFGGTDLI